VSYLLRAIVVEVEDLVGKDRFVLSRACAETRDGRL
jgi:hypothetical protein